MVSEDGEKKLADWRNRRVKLKSPRKLTKNQKRQYNALREEDRKVRALLAQFDARKLEDMDPEAPR